MNKMELIAILIPAYNEEKTIGQVIRTIPKQLNATVFVVDDGSTDRTSEISKNSGATVIQHHQNQGVGKAFFTGIQEIIRRNFDIIINMDADGQFNPEDIPSLILPIQQGKADMVTCTRHPYTGLPFMKKFGNRLFTKITSYIAKRKFTDTQCGFRAYSMRAAKALNLFGEYTYTQEAFLDLATKGFKIIEIPLLVKPQREGKSKVVKNVWSYGLKSLLIILKTLRDYRPLRFFGIPGLIMLLSGIALSAYSIIMHFLGQDIANHVIFFTSSVTLTILGSIICVLALVADMFDRVNKNQERILSKLKQ